MARTAKAKNIKLVGLRRKKSPYRKRSRWTALVKAATRLYAVRHTCLGPLHLHQAAVVWRRTSKSNVTDFEHRLRLQAAESQVEGREYFPILEGRITNG